MIICIMCLGIESNNQSEDEEGVAIEPGEENGRSPVINCFLSLGLALFGAVLMSSKHLIIRMFNKTGYTGFD